MDHHYIRRQEPRQMKQGSRKSSKGGTTGNHNGGSSSRRNEIYSDVILKCSLLRGRHRVLSCTLRYKGAVGFSRLPRLEAGDIRLAPELGLLI